jgi:hypothetical protein
MFICMIYMALLYLTLQDYVFMGRVHRNILPVRRITAGGERAQRIQCYR